MSELLRYRRWYRQNRWADWTAERTAHAIELRALVRLAREARRIAALAPDPITAAKAEADRRQPPDVDFHAWQAR